MFINWLIFSWAGKEKQSFIREIVSPGQNSQNQSDRLFQAEQTTLWPILYTMIISRCMPGENYFLIGLSSRFYNSLHFSLCLVDFITCTYYYSTRAIFYVICNLPARLLQYRIANTSIVSRYWVKRRVKR